MTEDDICPLDYYVKTRLATDMINLAREKNPESEFGSLTQIYPSEQKSLKMMSEVCFDLEKLFTSC